MLVRIWTIAWHRMDILKVVDTSMWADYWDRLTRPISITFVTKTVQSQYLRCVTFYYKQEVQQHFGWWVVKKGNAMLRSINLHMNLVKTSVGFSFATVRCNFKPKRLWHAWMDRSRNEAHSWYSWTRGHGTACKVELSWVELGLASRVAHTRLLTSRRTLSTARIDA